MGRHGWWPPPSFETRAHKIRAASHDSWRALLRMRTDQTPKTLLRRHLTRRRYDVVRRRVDLLDHLERLLAGLGRDRQPQLLRLGHELRVLHGGVEGVAENSHAFRRHRLRGDEWPADLRRRQQHAQHLSVTLARRDVDAVRNIRRHVRRDRPRRADHRHDLAALDPLQRNAAPGAAIAIELAALDRDALLGAAWIACHLLNAHAKDALENALIGVG